MLVTSKHAISTVHNFDFCSRETRPLEECQNNYDCLLKEKACEALQLCLTHLWHSFHSEHHWDSKPGPECCRLPSRTRCRRASTIARGGTRNRLRKASQCSARFKNYSFYHDRKFFHRVTVTHNTVGAPAFSNQHTRLCVFSLRARVERLRDGAGNLVRSYRQCLPVTQFIILKS